STTAIISVAITGRRIHISGKFMAMSSAAAGNAHDA
ncbi:unnamed protein product, partial [marine sediment metagenome]